MANEIKVNLEALDNAIEEEKVLESEKVVVTAEEIEDKKRMMKKNSRKIGLFSGGIIGLLTSGIAYLVLGISFLNVPVLCVICAVLIALGIAVALTMSGLLTNTFTTNLSAEGRAILDELKIFTRVKVWTVVFFMVIIIALLLCKFIFKII